MVAAALDTYRIVKRLRDVGFSDAQAETVTDVLAEASRTSLSELATKADIAAVEAKLDSLEQRMDARFESLEQRMTIKLGGMLVGGVAVVAVLVKLL